MGIYLYAEPLNYLALFFFMKWFGSEAFGSEKFALMLLLLRIFGTVIIALFVVRILRLLHIKYVS